MEKTRLQIFDITCHSREVPPRCLLYAYGSSHYYLDVFVPVCLSLLLTHPTLLATIFLCLISLLPLAEALMRLLTINSLFYSFLCSVLFAKCRPRKKRDVDDIKRRSTVLKKAKKKKSHEKEARNAKHQKMRRRLEIECENWQFSFSFRA